VLRLLVNVEAGFIDPQTRNRSAELSAENISCP